MDKTLIENPLIVNCSLPAILPGVMCPLPVARFGKQGLTQSSNGAVIVPEVGVIDGPRIGCQVEILSASHIRNYESNVIVRGLSRVQLSVDGLTGQSQSLVKSADVYDSAPPLDRSQRRLELCEAFCDRFPQFAQNWFVTPLLERDLPFGKLCDLLAFACELSPTEHAHILGETNVDRRSNFVLAMLLDYSRVMKTGLFPPAFSWN